MEYINGYKAEESLYTKDGKEISVLRLEVENEEKVLDEWATHFREQYRYMEDLDFERHGTRRTRQEHLRDYVFPSDSVRPGPSTRVGDFCEILVADTTSFGSSKVTEELHSLQRIIRMEFLPVLTMMESVACSYIPN